MQKFSDPQWECSKPIQSFIKLKIDLPVLSRSQTGRTEAGEMSLTSKIQSSQGMRL